MNHRTPTHPASMKAPALKGTCRWCALPIVDAKGNPDRRRTWHPACVTIYRVARFSDDQRRAVMARDKGVCARCGQDTMRLLLRFQRVRHKSRWLEPKWREGQTQAGYIALRGRYEARRERVMAAAGKRYEELRWIDRAPSPWQADHIRPLVESQGRLEFFLLANLQTLCTACHILKGREDNRRRKNAATLAGDGASMLRSPDLRDEP